MDTSTKEELFRKVWAALYEEGNKDELQVREVVDQMYMAVKEPELDIEEVFDKVQREIGTVRNKERRLWWNVIKSSIYGSDNRWGGFWSAGVGWNLHHEAFLKEAEWLRQFKLRASVGYTGSQNFNPYQAMATYKYFTDAEYDNIVGAYLMGHGERQTEMAADKGCECGI